MIHQIVEIQEENRYLSLNRGFLSINEGGTVIANVPLDDIAVLLVSAQHVSFSKHILTELAQRGGIAVLCGKNYAPQSIVMPVSGHYMQAGIIKTQIDASEPFKKNIWKQIIESKLSNQARTLSAVGKTKQAKHLGAIAATVKSGDSDNREGYGAKLYWKALFGKEWIREKEGGDGINAFLNYGYAVARAAVARAICASGLLPSLGVYHKNQLNPFCLADDFLEPFRPIVDLCVYAISKQLGQSGQSESAGLTPAIKKELADVLWAKLQTTEGNSPLFQAMHYLCTSYVKALKLKKPVIDIPRWEQQAEESQFERISDIEQI
ncbi:MAG: type II CRISPR-associated endonuclease Cas1 [Treponemataceae bacterium]|nr:MAG: type II CRISPR-associated endonuclease Cas1 [Treponemataceae bacterium]